MEKSREGITHDQHPWKWDFYIPNFESTGSRVTNLGTSGLSEGLKLSLQMEMVILKVFNGRLDKQERTCM